MRTSPRRGVAIVYFTLVIIVLFGFCSLVVDYARVRLAKSELQPTPRQWQAPA